MLHPSARRKILRATHCLVHRAPFFVRCGGTRNEWVGLCTLESSRRYQLISPSCDREMMKFPGTNTGSLQPDRGETKRILPRIRSAAVAEECSPSFSLGVLYRPGGSDVTSSYSLEALRRWKRWMTMHQCYWVTTSSTASMTSDTTRCLRILAPPMEASRAVTQHSGPCLSQLGGHRGKKLIVRSVSGFGRRGFMIIGRQRYHFLILISGLGIAREVFEKE